MIFFKGVVNCPSGSDELYCGDCTFELDTCGWADFSAGEFKWERVQAFGTGSSTQGPAQDHTSGSQTGKTLFNALFDK